jgi:hypothetical protein
MGLSVGPKTFEQEHQKNQKPHNDFSAVSGKKGSDFIHFSKVLSVLFHYLGLFLKSSIAPKATPNAKPIATERVVFPVF